MSVYYSQTHQFNRVVKDHEDDSETEDLPLAFMLVPLPPTPYMIKDSFKHIAKLPWQPHRPENAHQRVEDHSYESRDPFEFEVAQLSIHVTDFEEALLREDAYYDSWNSHYCKRNPGTHEYERYN